MTGPRVTADDLAGLCPQCGTRQRVLLDEIDRLREENGGLSTAHAYMVNANEIMRREKEHGWREAEKWEDRAESAERDLAAVLAEGPE